MNKVKETLSNVVSIIIGPQDDDYSTYPWGTIIGVFAITAFLVTMLLVFGS